ncbi:hypothetical protein BJ875DRAFT_345472, partial [Amylocarpus encephaloides]
FWLYFVERKSLGFDTAYWDYIDERLFGKRGLVVENDLWKLRLHLLTKNEREAIDNFVEKTMKE